jgi:pimeloyl-ACP methyl ester carboxylesterase
MAQKRRMIRKIITSIALIAAAPLVVIALARGATEFASRILEKRYPPPGRMIAVGYYKLQLYCTGTGSPTVIIEPGMGLDWVGWRPVIARLTPFHSVCVYDRAGYGWSDPGPRPRTASREADELHTLLSTAGIADPYILVAHSFGGYIARIYASRFRKSLAGVVLVEPSHEDEPALAQEQGALQVNQRSCRACQILNLIPPLGVQRLRRMYHGYRDLPDGLKNEPRCYQERYLVASSLEQLALERNEFDSLHFSEAQVRQAVFPRDLPLTVITALHLLAPKDSRHSTALPPIHRELQQRLAQSSLYGRQIIAAGSGHMVPLDEPEVIVDAVQDLAKQPKWFDHGSQ